MTSDSLHELPPRRLVNPAFPGGLMALQAYIANNRQAGITTENSVFVEFVVGADGKVIDSDCVVLRGGGMEADLEAVRLVTAMPTWTPGTLDGQPVAVKLVVPVHLFSKH